MSDKETGIPPEFGANTPVPRRSHITQSDIARAAGVSRATVSLVLRNSSTIPHRTREHVLRCAEQLGYVYNRGAASLRTASTHTVGLVVHDITNPYFAETVAAIQRELGKQGRVAFLGDTGDSPEQQRAFVDTIREYNVDGIIMSPAAGTDAAWIARLKDWRLPCVTFSRTLADADVDYVGGDNFGGTRQATEHLLALGHRRIAMIGANQAISTGRERLAGYRGALSDAGLKSDENLIVACPATRKAGHDALIHLLCQKNAPTAAVCFNDVIAFGVMLALQNLGRKAGKDFSVIGYDDVPEAVLWSPGLTTQRVVCDAIGQTAVRLLLRRLAEPTAPTERVIIPPEFQVRQTTLKPPSKSAMLALRAAALQWKEGAGAGA